MDQVLKDKALTNPQITSLAALYQMLKHNLPIDHNPWNQFWDGKQLTLVEAGRYGELDDWWLKLDSWHHYWFNADQRGLERFIREVNELRKSEQLAPIQADISRLKFSQ